MAVEHGETPPDSVGAGLPRWIGQMPSGVDPGVEAARQRIGRIARLFERILERAAGHESITVGDWAALSVLRRSGPPYERTPKQLADALGLTSGTISVRVDRLTRAGLVEPAPATDGRSRPIRLTEEGHRLWSAATARRTMEERRLFGGAFDEDELDRLNSLLGALLSRLEEEFGPAPRHDRPRPGS
ncbi:MarR family winged helix-turn-helix transcriptional regulator [Actinoallomurus soli]|uniref:MarR family winged helix-turn-helix transcriptional regulator n=1 Tax=Actinoallomurus soli TaxID=2952535 RepID=UPI002091FD54|nr:MarR family transcriptional regulator [Actinoallomurus soli]MCO5972030.1 MarR family transcriptional regulator [Actinoallomurus soli]